MKLLDACPALTAAVLLFVAATVSVEASADVRRRDRHAVGGGMTDYARALIGAQALSEWVRDVDGSGRGINSGDAALVGEVECRPHGVRPARGASGEEYENPRDGAE